MDFGIVYFADYGGFSPSQQTYSAQNCGTTLTCSSALAQWAAACPEQGWLLQELVVCPHSL